MDIKDIRERVSRNLRFVLAFGSHTPELEPLPPAPRTSRPGSTPTRRSGLVQVIRRNRGDRRSNQ